ncbi:unnamed protein product [Eruca vesicaria subsp. sativa]|uniref:Uncharacterized protein n=1 Tax=Eruca vesicaria subsp. sativa TaxID=29727 RepID=A0ABC8L149_ERUVS|nr:unnamed protein product [Eruca vesicaria subsp. sativa]
MLVQSGEELRQTLSEKVQQAALIAGRVKKTCSVDKKLGRAGKVKQGQTVEKRQEYLAAKEEADSLRSRKLRRAQIGEVLRREVWTDHNGPGN